MERKQYMEKEISFNDSEHLGGQHNTFQENCYECSKENNLLQAKKTVVASNYPEGINRFNPPWLD